MSEGALSKSVRDALAQLGVWCLRVNAGGYRGRARGAPAGTPDILGRFPLWHPRAKELFAVETKASHRDACSCESCTEQRKWRVEHERDGGLYVRARSVHEALEGLGLLTSSAAREIAQESNKRVNTSHGRRQAS